ncbi:MAG TPA: SpoIIE family protein phosphatase [Acidimicrobiales bacterium]|nr:SpoIIE family protein phosphatase [Acidimicrobiales bacterium]
MDERARMEAVRRYDILDTPPDGAFDRVTALAARLLDAPIAIVSVVDEERIWFKSHHGLPDVVEIGRETGLCASAILQEGPWVVNDAAVDPRTLTNSLVAGEFGLRFYAGVPLTVSGGHSLGTLCVLDTQPREISERELRTLEDLAAVVVDELELRLQANETFSRESELRRQAEALADALQASLLPPRPPRMPGMELATRYRAGERGMQVGGDFFDVFRLAANAWGFVVGDVCGKGARAASLTGLARWGVRAGAVHHTRPSMVLEDLNRLLLSADDDAADDHFCAAVFARVELDTCGAWVTLASAGHPRPLVLRRAGWIDVRGHVALPLGMYPDAGVADDRVGLGPGDSIVICTDGITEARDRRGELFGEDDLAEVLLDGHDLGAEELADRILDAATSYAGGRLHDDAAILVLRVPPDAVEDPSGRVARATGVPVEELRFPGYPLGDAQPDLWKQPPAPPREARMRLGAQAADVPVLRQLLRRLLSSWRLDHVEPDDLELMATELATNALRHAGGGATVIVRYLGDAIRLEVGDGSRELPQARSAAEDDTGGRGLMLVASLATAWGVVPTLGGKRVWCEVALPSPPGAST